MNDTANVIVERALLARVDELERQAREAREARFEAERQASLDRRTAFSCERYSDVVREAAMRLKPIAREGNTEALLEAIEAIRRMHPEHWGPNGTLPPDPGVDAFDDKDRA